MRRLLPPPWETTPYISDDVLDFATLRFSAAGGKHAKPIDSGEDQVRPRLYIEVPPMNIRFRDGITEIDLRTNDVARTRTSEVGHTWMRPEDATRLQGLQDAYARTNDPRPHTLNTLRALHRTTGMHHPPFDLTDPPNEAYAHTRAYDRAANTVVRLQQAIDSARWDLGL